MFFRVSKREKEVIDRNVAKDKEKLCATVKEMRKAGSTEAEIKKAIDGAGVKAGFVGAGLRYSRKKIYEAIDLDLQRAAAGD